MHRFSSPVLSVRLPVLPTLRIAVGSILALTLTFTAAPAFAQPQEKIPEDVVNKLLESTKDVTDLESRDGQIRVSLLQQRGQDLFFVGKIKESIRDFDAVIKLDPKQDPHHWQRGISYYYAEDYEAGKAQFERHQTVNTQDVENAVWHFLCAVRVKDGTVEAARKKLIPIERDTRVPMKQVHDLFAGKAKDEDVLAVCESRNDKCYAHLYLGLYYEGIGEVEKAQQHIELSANDFQMDHYMGKVAQVHAKLRGWKSPIE